jgi:GNAT superfamily N-acetyltransferase
VTGARVNDPAPQLRRAAPGDAASIAECLAELGYGTPAALVGEKLAELAASRADAVFVAVHAATGRVLGVASVHLVPLFHAPGNLARITALAVRAAAQGAGVGRALVGAAEAFAWAAHCRRVEVTSGDHRPAAHAFYVRLGYQVDERRFIKAAPAAGAG